MPLLKDRKDRRYGQLTVLSRAENDSHGNARWECLCDCGNTTTVLGQQLTKGQKSCGCITSHLRPYESLYNRMCTMAAHPVHMTYEEYEAFTQCTECHYCGANLVWRIRYAGKGGWQLDRKDTKLPYTASNCVPCCKRCNFGKGKHFTYEEWKQIGELIRGWKK